MNKLRAGISLCMIVKDEERFLGDALASVAGIVDEICIVDTGSSDRTIDIARAHGARILQAAWQDDFSHARNLALALASRRWIFVLDADERLDSASRSALLAIGRAPVNGRGKWITCRNLTDSCKGSGAMSHALIRIFPNDKRIRYRNPIHEFVALDRSDQGLPADLCEIEIVHHGYLGSIVTERDKPKRNLELCRRAAEADPSDGFHQYNLGMAQILGGQGEGAIAALERMRELTRETPRGYRLHGLLALADQYAEVRGDLHTALTLVRECLAYVPNYSNAHFLAGRLLARSGDLFEARNAFGRAIAAGAHDREQFVVDDEIAIWKAHAEIGGTLMRERRYAQALAWFELASQARPAAQPLVINRAKCHEALGDHASARMLFESAYTSYRDAAATIEWINFLFRRADDAQALMVIDRAQSYVDEDTQITLLGIAAAAQLRAGNRRSAAAALERAMAAGEPHAAFATLTTLAHHLNMTELIDLLPPPLARANGLQIAYVSCS